MKIDIRKATHNDATTLALLARITYKEAFGYLWDKTELIEYLDVTFSVAKIEGSLQKKNNIFWIAFANNMPVGYAKLKVRCPYEKLSDQTPAQLQKIYLLGDYTGMRIGAKLQNEVFDEVRREKIKTLWLAVWDGNHKAIKFYEQHGFTKTTTYRYDFQNTNFDYEVMTKIFP